MEQKTALITSYHLYRGPFKTGMHFITEYFIKKGWRVGFLTIPFSLFSLKSDQRDIYSQGL